MPPVPPQAQQFLDALVATPPLESYLVVGAIMFAIGAWGALIRRNAVVVFMCVELMINAVNLTLVAFADYLPNAGGLGVSYAVLVIAIAAAEIAVVVCFVSLMIQLYSGAFMEGDPRFAWYYACLNLFTASMLGLVLSPNFIELYVFWELVGLCSYLLVGHWYEKPSARDAAIKAFVVTRIGDAALFVGIIIFWATTGSVAFTDISVAAQSGFIGGSLLTTTVILVFIGAVGKSAQFPLHVWLPDAMEGPTPVSALIHAVTMVAAGVYLVACTY